MEDSSHGARRDFNVEIDQWEYGEMPIDLSHLPQCPGIPSTDEEIAAADARAEADIAAGRVYPHAIIGEWLLTWGKPGRKPFKEWLADTHG